MLLLQVFQHFAFSSSQYTAVASLVYGTIRDSRGRWCNLFPFMKTRPEAVRRKQTRLRAVDISSNIMSTTNISNLLLQNINEPLPVETQLDKALTWGKSLSTLSIFTRRKIDLHVRKCGKLKEKSISKTSVRGRLFKHKRFLSSDSVYTAFNLLYFFCQSSMQSNYEERITKFSDSIV